LEEVKKYINENNKRPSSTDKNKKIKKMGNWLSRQQTNYKKQTQIMMNEEIKLEWENFVNNEKYAKYFK
jgi:hypothetical protein